MLSGSGLSLLFALLLGVIAHLYDRHRHADRRQVFQEQCRALRTAASDPRLVFDGGTATVVYENEDKIVRRDLRSFYCLCKNEHGEYFLLTSGYKRPRLMHLSRERAMNVLRIDRAAFEREFGGSTRLDAG